MGKSFRTGCKRCGYKRRRARRQCEPVPLPRVLLRVDKNLVSPFNNWLANAWNWLNGTAWYQILVKNIVLTAISTGLGALFGFIFGPVGSLAGTIIGAFAGIVVGVLWDFGVSGINP